MSNFSLRSTICFRLLMHIMHASNRDHFGLNPELKIRQVVLFILRFDFCSAFCIEIAHLLRNHESKLVGRPRQFPEIIKRKNCWSLQLLPHKLCKSKVSLRRKTCHIKHAMGSKILKCVRRRQTYTFLMDEFDDFGQKTKVIFSGTFYQFLGAIDWHVWWPDFPYFPLSKYKFACRFAWHASGVEWARDWPNQMLSR